MSKSIFEQDPSIEPIKLLFNNCYTIPVFQRPYTWGKDEINEFFKDLEEHYLNDEELFIGTVYLTEDSKIGTSLVKYSLIDGQQRITTMSLTMLIIYMYSVKYELLEEDLVRDIKRYLWKKPDGRRPDKNCRLLTSDGIEHKIIKKLFDTFFDIEQKENKDKIIEDLINDLKDIKCDNKLEENVIENICIINDKINSIIESTDDVADKLLDFIRYLLDCVNVISIIVSKDNLKRLFEVFEAINSKGKQLEDIDLIKSYIFQHINSDDYDEYLQIWGDLIKETEDHLGDYLNVYMKSFVNYYRNKLSAKMFKNHYKGSDADLDFVFKNLLIDLNSKVDTYKHLINKEWYLLKNKSDFQYFTEAIRELKYEHPKPLLFRAYCEYEQGNISKEELTSITKASLTYMLTFQTISNRDSKDAIDVFEKIMKSVIKNDYDFSTEEILYVLGNDLEKNGMNKEDIKHKLLNFKGYGKTGEKECTRVIIPAFEYCENNKIKYEQAKYVLLHGNELHIDHILPQYPADDADCSYYCDKDSDVEILRLKPNNDFDIPGIEDGIEYDVFKDSVLNKLGKLRISWRSDNIDKSNCIIELKDYGDFNTYSQIKTRAMDLANKSVDCELFNIDYNKNYRIENKERHQTSLPRINWLLEHDIVKSGDELELISDSSVHATLLSDGKVNYNGEKLSIQKFLRKATGWKSVETYEYLRKVGEDKNLKQLRAEAMEKFNWNEERDN